MYPELQRDPSQSSTHGVSDQETDSILGMQELLLCHNF